MEDLPAVREEVVRERLGSTNVHQSMAADGMHPRELRELAEVIAEPLSVIFEKSWRMGEVPEDRRRANVTAVFKKGKKGDPGNDRPVSLTSVPGKVMEQLCWMSSPDNGRKGGDQEQSARVHQGEVVLHQPGGLL